MIDYLKELFNIKNRLDIIALFFGILFGSMLFYGFLNLFNIVFLN